MGTNPVASPPGSTPSDGVAPGKVNDMSGSHHDPLDPHLPPGDPPDGRPPAASRPESAGPEGAHPSRGLGGRIHGVLDRIRAKPTGRVALKITVGAVGAIVVAVGLMLIPLPGPGWALVILGLAILAVEFVWARHLLRFTKRHVQSWTRWVTRQSLSVRLVIGAVSLVFVSAVVWTSVRLSLGIDLIAVGLELISGG